MLTALRFSFESKQYESIVPTKLDGIVSVVKPQFIKAQAPKAHFGGKLIFFKLEQDKNANVFTVSKLSGKVTLSSE